MSRQVIDARGLSCPQPAVMTKQALAHAKNGEVEVLVDTATARDNVARTACLAGWKVTTQDLSAGEYKLVLAR